MDSTKEFNNGEQKYNTSRVLYVAHLLNCSTDVISWIQSSVIPTKAAYFNKFHPPTKWSILLYLESWALYFLRVWLNTTCIGYKSVMGPMHARYYRQYVRYGAFSPSEKASRHYEPGSLLLAGSAFSHDACWPPWILPAIKGRSQSF